jgi:hypothetical protein
MNGLWWEPAPPASPRYSWPPSWAPSKDQLTYTKELVTVTLLVLAVPWLFARLVHDPAGLLADRGRTATRSLS